MPAKSKTPFGTWVSAERHSRNWVNGTYYRNGQPFQTLARMEPDFLVSQIKGFVSCPAKTIALEIGPGENPLLPSIGFKKMVFLEKSPKIAAILKKEMPVLAFKENLENFKGNKKFEAAKWFIERASVKNPFAGMWLDVKFNKLAGTENRVVVGDIRRLPFFKEKMFGFVLINEVLTHLKPSERKKAIKWISRISNRIFIVDRSRKTLKEIKEMEKKRAKKVLKKLEGKKSIKAAKEREMERTWVNLPDCLAKKIRGRQVDFSALIDFFEKNGWSVKTVSKKEYLVLKAKKKAKAKQ